MSCKICHVSAADIRSNSWERSGSSRRETPPRWRAVQEETGWKAGFGAAQSRIGCSAVSTFIFGASRARSRGSCAEAGGIGHHIPVSPAHSRAMNKKIVVNREATVDTAWGKGNLILVRVAHGIDCCPRIVSTVRGRRRDYLIGVVIARRAQHVA